MQPPGQRARVVALGIKTVGLAVGVAAILLAAGLAFDELSHLAVSSGLGVGDVVTLLAIVSLALGGTALVAQLPESLRARFRKTAPESARSKPVYGFGAMLAVGVGATLGSPLFILIPLNVEQYEFVSLISLMLATVLSIAMARVYADLGKKSKELGVTPVGGPSFARLAGGARSVRYFVSRVSMWIANTALAAYSKIVFLIFDFIFIPQILTADGFSSGASALITWSIAAGFVGWTVINIFFEQKYLKALGGVQIVLTAALVVMIVYHAALLGGSTGWNFAGFFSIPGGIKWLPALIINTGYLYLLFFGFQEIQVMDRDSVEKSAIPLVSWLKKGYTLSKTSYFELAMILSVVIAASVNILYALAVYSAGHGLTSLQTSCATSSCIPALYIAQNLLGGNQALLIGAAFLIATATTFIPAFLAAARHLGALGEDGYMPVSLAGLSWVFTLAAILLLAIGNENFLVEITDVMVLISLGIIALSALSLKGIGSRTDGKALGLAVGLGCFLFGGAIYFVPGGSSVVIFGSLTIMFAYVIFDIIELGTLGAQLFLSVLGSISLFAMLVFVPSVYAGGSLSSVAQLVGTNPTGLLFWGLMVASILLVLNVFVDVGVLRRTSAAVI